MKVFSVREYCPYPLSFKDILFRLNETDRAKKKCKIWKFEFINSKIQLKLKTLCKFDTRRQSELEKY